MLRTRKSERRPARSGRTTTNCKWPSYLRDCFDCFVDCREERLQTRWPLFLTTISQTHSLKSLWTGHFLFNEQGANWTHLQSDFCDCVVEWFHKECLAPARNEVACFWPVLPCEANLAISRICDNKEFYRWRVLWRLLPLLYLVYSFKGKRHNPILTLAVANTHVNNEDSKRTWELDHKVIRSEKRMHHKTDFYKQ